jgi:hypothetical protein
MVCLLVGVGVLERGSLTACSSAARNRAVRSNVAVFAAHVCVEAEELV